MKQNELNPSVERSYFPSNYREILYGSVYGTIAGLGIHAYDRRMERSVQGPKQGIAQFFLNFHLRFPRLGPAITLGYVGVMVPLFEETLFNGWISDSLRGGREQSLKSQAKRVVVISSLFSLSHVEVTKGLNFNFRVCRSAFIAGFIFSLIAEKTGNLWGSTFAHSLVNVLTLRRIKK
ncbi:MAG: CPBP family intramembrane metalloprotease [Chlamydiales bacterium]|nr:CPBP family intramembrane metalloprotease [Chlamydiales bacterium]